MCKKYIRSGGQEYSFGEPNSPPPVCQKNSLYTNMHTVILIMHYTMCMLILNDQLLVAATVAIRSQTVLVKRSHYHIEHKSNKLHWKYI